MNPIDDVAAPVPHPPAASPHLQAVIEASATLPVVTRALIEEKWKGIGQFATAREIVRGADNHPVLPRDW